MFSRTKVKVTHARHFTVTAQWRSSHSRGWAATACLRFRYSHHLGAGAQPRAPRPPACVLPLDIHSCRPLGATTAARHGVRCRLLSRSLMFAHPRRLL